MKQVALDQLLSSPGLYSGSEVVTSGRLLSHTASEFWLVRGKEDIAAGRGVRLVHLDLDLLLFDNVPLLGGSYMLYHPVTVAGTLRLLTGQTPALEINHLKKLVVTAAARTYELI